MGIRQLPPEIRARHDRHLMIEGQGLADRESEPVQLLDAVRQSGVTDGMTPNLGLLRRSRVRSTL